MLRIVWKIDLILKKKKKEGEDLTPENLTGKEAYFFFLSIETSLNLSIFLQNLGLLR